MWFSLESFKSRSLHRRASVGSTSALIACQRAEVWAGCKSRALAYWGSPGTWEALPSPHHTKPAGAGRSKPRPFERRVPCPKGAKQADAGVVPRSKGNRASRDGRQWSQHSIVPSKRGNRPQGSPWREGGCREAFRSGRTGRIQRKRRRDR